MNCYLSLLSVQNKEVGYPIELRLVTASGWRLMELVGTPVAWYEDGALLLCLRDLTTRRRFELAHDQNARLRSLVQNSGAAIIMLVSPEGMVESVSGAFTRLFRGADPELVEGQPLAELVSEPDRPALKAALEGTSVAHAFGRARSTDGQALPLPSRAAESTPFELAIVEFD